MSQRDRRVTARHRGRRSGRLGAAGLSRGMAVGPRDRRVDRGHARRRDPAIAPETDETDETDPVTQDLLIAVASALEQAHWMWQAQLVT
jgi:hypothetical protein